MEIKSFNSGWINRIRVSLNGYGKALYIEHLDGSTSVYGHLKNSAQKLNHILRKNNMKKNHI